MREYLNRSRKISPNTGRSLWGNTSSVGKITRSIDDKDSTATIFTVVLRPMAAIFSSAGMVEAWRRWTSSGQKNAKSCPADMRRLPRIRLVELVGNMITEFISENTCFYLGFRLSNRSDFVFKTNIWTPLKRCMTYLCKIYIFETKIKRQSFLNSLKRVLKSQTSEVLDIVYETIDSFLYQFHFFL